MQILTHCGLCHDAIRVPILRIVQKKNIVTASIHCTNNVKNKILMKSEVKGSNNITRDVRKYSLFKRMNYAKYISLRHATATLFGEYMSAWAISTIPMQNEEITELFVDFIKEDLLSNASFVIDVAPFKGHLTKTLLDCGVPKMYTLRHTNNESDEIKLLKSKYDERLHLIDIPLYKLSNYLAGKPIFEADAVKKVVDLMPTAEWTEPPCMQVVGTVKTKFFLNEIISAAMFQTNLMSQGRVSFYICIGPLLWKTLHGDSSNLLLYRHISVMFQLFFDCKQFGSIHDAKFERKFKTKAYSGFFGKQEKRLGVVVMKVEPKPDLFNILPETHIHAFWFFIRQIMFRRKNRIIPLLENWVPGCGPLLIQQNINMYTYVGDLSPQQLLDIFMQFSSWPEYETSDFYLNVSKHMF